jgi:hypothetical protein
MFSYAQLSLREQSKIASIATHIVLAVFISSCLAPLLSALRAEIWAPEVRLWDDDFDDRSPHVEVGFDGQPWVFWEGAGPDGGGADILYVRWDGDAWSPVSAVHPPDSGNDVS